MVLTLTMAKEAYDDFNTYKRDIQVEFSGFRPTQNSMMWCGGRDLLESRARI